MYQGKFDKKNKQGSTAVSIPAAKVRAVPERRGRLRLGGVVFYTVLSCCIFLFYAATYFGLVELRGWLFRYELAQPDRKSQEVFQQLFQNANWGELYDAAGMQDTMYESKEVFIRYMESVAEGNDLSCMETSAGLSSGKKYIVRLGNQKIATFTLKGHNAGEDAQSIPDWQLGGVELHLDRSEGIRIEKAANHRAYVNGIALDDSHTVQTSTTAGAEYLPAGVDEVGMCVQELTGLIAVPTVKILDENGAEMPVLYDEARGTFVEQLETPVISEQDKELALQALKTYALYMMNQASASEVAKYYKKSSDAYNSITDTELGYVQDAAQIEFTDEAVRDYRPYCDTLFSVRASVTLNQYRTSGSVKESIIDQSLFFEKQDSGKWLCYAMTSVDVSQPVVKVRVAFLNEGQTLSSDFYERDSSQIICPMVTVPEGKVLSGWFTEEREEGGGTVKNLVFVPDENGVAHIPTGTEIRAMTVYPLFEDA